MSKVDPSSLIASLIVGSIGYVAFAYGKRQRRPPQLIVGLALMVFPYFVEDVLVMSSIAGALVLLMWLAVKLGW